MAETGDEGRGRLRHGGSRAERLPQGGGVSRHAHDRPISGDQGGQRRLPPVLPHGRFLRAVLRGRRDRLARARHRAHQARQASGRGHPDVRRAGACRRRLSPAPDRREATGSRSASRSRTRPRPRSAGPRRWCAATWCASSRPGTLTEETLLDARAHNFLTALFRAPSQGGRRAGLRARLARHLDRRVDRLVGRRRAILPASLRGSSPARCWSATISPAMPRCAA